MADLSLDYIYNVSVSQLGQAIGRYNTSNIGIITADVPGVSFGADNYKIYQEPLQVGKDFGTASETYKAAVAIYSQKPNLKAGGGYLVIFKRFITAQLVQFVADAGGVTLNFNGQTAPILFNTSPADLQTQIQSIPGYESVTVIGSAGSYFIEFKGINGKVPLITFTANTLENSGTPVVPDVDMAADGETMSEAIIRTNEIVHYFGLLTTYELDSVEYLAAAATLAPLRKVAAFACTSVSSVQAGGKALEATLAGYNNTRAIFRTLQNGQTLSQALVFAAGYLSRALSVDFTGSDTTITMHLKDIAGTTADAGITDNILQLCKVAGAEFYGSFRGIPKTFTSGANKFFDQVHNLLWFVETAQLAAVNVLAQTSTKVPQTEDGVNLIKAAVKNQACEPAVRNGYIAPGTWNSPVTFGVQEDFFANIEQYGYYIYTSPIAEQSPADREARIAPLMQIALKEKGAIHSGNIIININA